MLIWPWNLHPSPGIVDDTLRVGQAALHNAYLAGFKDGLLLAVAVFSLLLVLFRRD
jgi:hypothetical protein